MRSIKLKETYLLLLIVIGLVSLSLYTTYALFIANTEITDVVSFSTNLTTDSSILEYEMVTVPSGESKVVELVVTNSHTSSIYYGVWYQNLTGIADMEIGVYTEKNSTPASGSIDASSSKTILIGISNDSSNDLIINIGVVGSETSNLNLSSNRTLITDEWAPAVIVTQEYLDEHTTTNTETVNLEYTTPKMTEVTLQSGTYKLEVWGAQGGYRSSTTYGGKGGYSYGTLTLTDSVKAYVYVGGSGNTGGTAGGFNGGGKRGTYNGGGGASDIRLGTDSLYARVIVAGGGGSDGASSKTGMYGGGTQGGATTANYGTGGFAGTQTGVSSSSWQTTTQSTSTTTQAGAYAGFGFGGNGITRSSGYGGAGGGGWYGGSGSYPDTSGDDDRGGGGGSGYVYTSSTYSNYPSGCLLNSNYYLTDAATVAGNTSFTDFSGSTVTGHSGDGAVRISGSYNVTKYTIPRVLGLTDLYVPLGNNVSLTSGVSHECETDSTSCTYIGPNINDTSSLAIGEYTIYYTIKDSNGKKYNYPRKISVGDSVFPEQVLANLGLTANATIPDFTTAATTDEGLFALEDDLGTSYYFRGAVTNNYVKFANFYWRIIRINGNGSIRMIYQGTSANSTGTDAQIGTSAYNTNYGSNAYVGYMYGTPNTWVDQGRSSSTSDISISSSINYYYGTSYTFDSVNGRYSLSGTKSNNAWSSSYVGYYTCKEQYVTYSCEKLYYISSYVSSTEAKAYTYTAEPVGVLSYEETHANINSSTIKDFLDTWYDNNLADYSSYLDGNAGFCNDRTLRSGTGVGADHTTYINHTYTKEPSFKCTNIADLFTLNSSNFGNKKLTRPIGLLTVDEAICAGTISSMNATIDSYYLYTGQEYWTMSPSYYSSSPLMITVMRGGSIYFGYVVYGVAGVRPVISLKSSAIKYGTGTAADPFRLTSEI